jgi:hypothetical protein
VRCVRNCQDKEKCLISKSEWRIKRKKSARGVRDYNKGLKISRGSLVICDIVSARAK